MQHEYNKCFLAKQSSNATVFNKITQNKKTRRKYKENVKIIQFKKKTEPSDSASLPFLNQPAIK